MHQQKLEDAVVEAQKPLARHRDDEDLDRMLREQQREGDPMAAMLRRKKERNTSHGEICLPSSCVGRSKMVSTYNQTVNTLILFLQTNLDTKAHSHLPTASIFYQAIAGMELTGAVLVGFCCVRIVERGTKVL